ncbi:alginate O-acetyltransferase AlgX-related protein [Paramagnetospirillum magneticum]|uniref:AlgX/AlgJ SGNH hydrolase-like domain-containing protein n=1 Tax=Paramagnetospirillum magneticum (strain ATCC 700264 / AMB-1) TaxID=342108 RepID=Q2W8F7_PARM1|nr:hypothetical protein [Paramagnetospirillum magneticum]BAE49868.1 hypothetical protein amb1064 [Paramagnetospirillum magneticum AMB-1]
MPLRKIATWLPRLLALCAIALMALPGAQYLFQPFRPPSIREHLPAPPAMPGLSISSFLDGSLQSWVTAVLARDSSARPFALTARNEAFLRLFPTRPNRFYTYAEPMGFYPVDTIRRLNYDLRNGAAVATVYREAAERVKLLQRLLAAKGVVLMVVAPPPKVRLYPEYLESGWLDAPATEIWSRSPPQYSNALAAQGVLGLNVFEMLWRDRGGYPWPFFATTGFHWSFWTGCMVTARLFETLDGMSGRPWPGVDCSETKVDQASGPDTDIAVVLNIVAPTRLLRPTPFVTAKRRSTAGGEGRKLLVIGDSYSDQIVYHALRLLGPANVVFWDYFAKQRTFNDKMEATITDLSKDGVVRRLVENDFDAVLVVTSDGNVSRDNPSRGEFGFTSAALTELLSRPGTGGQLPDAAFVEGWRPHETFREIAAPQAALAFVGPGGMVDRMTLSMTWQAAPADSAALDLDVTVKGVPVGTLTVPPSGGEVSVSVPRGAAGSTEFISVTLSPKGNTAGYRLTGARVSFFR